MITIRSAIENNNYETVRKEAHSIKGGAANLIADDLSAIALELSGKSGDFQNANEILDQLQKELDALIEFVKDKR